MKRSSIKRKTALRSKPAFHAVSRGQGKKRKRKTTTPLKKAKDTLWQLCRGIIFHRYGDVCYTCDKTGLRGSNRQLGHFITKSTCSAPLAYHLDNLRPQCYHCNINLSGNWIEFEERLNEEMGPLFSQALKELNRLTKGGKYDILWYMQKIKEYEAILRELDPLSDALGTEGTSFWN
jgi:hypothetical protein